MQWRFLIFKSMANIFLNYAVAEMKLAFTNLVADCRVYEMKLTIERTEDRDG